MTDVKPVLDEWKCPSCGSLLGIMDYPICPVCAAFNFAPLEVFVSE